MAGSEIERGVGYDLSSILTSMRQVIRVARFSKKGSNQNGT